MTNASGYNDKAKLADAIALAQSFSKAKPAKSRGKPVPNTTGHIHGRQLRSAARQQLTQSIVRPGALNPAATSSHRQLSLGHHQQFSSASMRRPVVNSRPMMEWRAKKELPSITGGRGLDFLSRNDASDSSTLAVQSNIVANMEPTSTPPTDLVQYKTEVDATTSAPKSSVLDAYYALMSQHEKEMAQVEPLVDKLKQWNLQSPGLAKSKPAAISIQPHSPAPVTLRPTVICDTEIKNVQSKGLDESKDIDTNKKIDGDHIGNQGSKEYVAGPQDKIQTGADLALQRVGDLLPHSPVSFKVQASPATPMVAVRLPPTPQQEENEKSPVKAHPMSAEAPKTPGQANCICAPVIKPQRGLASSRFATKETLSSRFANNFAVNLQITVHQDFCPLYYEDCKLAKGPVKNGGRIQQKLRAEAEAFTPTPTETLIASPGF